MPLTRLAASRLGTLSPLRGAGESPVSKRHDDAVERRVAIDEVHALRRNEDAAVGLHQAVALRLADMATRIEAVRALLERAAQAVDDNAPDAETLCNMVKLFASEEILKIAQHCLELHGGNGVMLDFGVEKIFRDAAIFLHMDATVDISKLKIVKSMFPATAGKYAGPE